jgi:hypothetical protein
VPPEGYPGASLEVGMAPTFMHLLAVQGFIHTFDSEQTRLALSDMLAYTTTISIHESNSDGDTPPHFAVSRGNTKGGLTLLRLGADASAKNHVRVTPLHMICRLGSMWCNPFDSDGEQVRFAQLDLEFPWGSSADWVSKMDDTNLSEHQDYVQELCQAGADFNVLYEKGNSALHWACLYWKRLGIKRSFQDLGADVNQLNAQGRSPLDFIADEFLEVILEKKRRSLEDHDARYLRHRKWIRDPGGRTAEELNTSQYTRRLGLVFAI